ncbi:MAG: FtsX-like permease family protein, partial [Chloroflexi bacterium]|nr:FtsX-like permease family protein [Chloroflexota bacterium]
GFGSAMQGQLFAYTGGVTLAVLAVAMLAVYFGAGARPAFTVAGLALVWYWLLPLPFSLLFEAGKGFTDPIDGVLKLVGLDPDPGDGNIEMFFVSGISITAAATLVVIFNASVLLRVVSGLGGVLGGITPAVRTAVAYPLAAKFRTAMTLAMFGLIVFSLVVMAFLTFNFSQLFLGDDAAAGYDVRVTGNALNRTPDLREALRETGYDVDARIGGVGTAVSQFPVVEANLSGGEAGRYRLLGVDDEFLRLASLPLQFRAVGYDSDEAVIEALRTDPTVAIVDGSRVGGRQGGGLFGGDREPEFIIPLTDIQLRDEPWQPIPITLREPGTDQVLDLRVIGVLEPGVAGVLVELFAVITARENVINVFDGGQVDDFFVNTTGDRSTAAAKELADDIESALLDRGVQAESILQLINERSAQSAGFQLLFEGFMGLGLIVGIAALGVIAFRTVVERRQQIGMLRAIGYKRSTVALSFMMESSFVTLLGISSGVGLAVWLSYFLLTSDEFPTSDAGYAIPWLQIGIFSGLTFLASLVMTYIPSRQAASVPIADALRYE